MSDLIKSDLIKREDAIGALCDAVDNKGDYEGEWLYTDEFCKAIDSVPSADRPQGEWLYKDDDVFAGEYACSNCNRRAEVDLYGQWILSNYCPHCGARMKGADDE